MIYLGTPYSSPLPTVVEERVRKAIEFTGLMSRQGFVVFSPVVYYHPIARAFGLPTDANHWHNVNMQYLRRAECLWVLRLVGWEQSKGLITERKLAKALSIPIIHFDANFQPLNDGAPIVEDFGKNANSP